MCGLRSEDGIQPEERVNTKSKAKIDAHEARIKEESMLLAYQIQVPDFLSMVRDLRKAGVSSTKVSLVAGCDPSAFRHLMRPSRRKPGVDPRPRVSWRIGEAIITLWEIYCRNGEKN